MKRMKTILWVIMVMAICLLVPGCADDEPECASCALKQMSIDARNNDIRVQRDTIGRLGAKYDASLADRISEMKLANNAIRSIENQLLKANTETARCYVIIEELTPDPNEGPYLPEAAVELTSTPVKYGQGDPPDEYVAMFGNDNGARLDFMQNQTINKIGNALAALSERVKVLEPEATDDKTN